MASRLHTEPCQVSPGGCRPEPAEFLPLPGPHFAVCPVAPSRWLGFRQSKFEKEPKVLRQSIGRVSYPVPPKASCDPCLIPQFQKRPDTVRTLIRSKTGSLGRRHKAFPSGTWS